MVAHHEFPLASAPVGSLSWPSGPGCLGPGRRQVRARSFRCHIRGAVQERLAAQAVADVPGFADGQCRGVGIAQPGEMCGVIEKPVGGNSR
jgi:hypothetical protein